MKGQRTTSHRQLSEDIKIPADSIGISHRHSINANADDVSHEDPGYVQLSDLSQEVRPRTTGVLGTLAALGISSETLRQTGVVEQPLQRLLTKELSCSRYFRWAFVDNFVEKILQGLILNKQDISQEEINFCRGMIRQVPSGRSLLLHQACGLRKMYAARGFVLTTEMVLTEAVKAFITVSLSYRLYNWFTTGDQNFSEFTTLFDDNTQKGISSLARLLLSNFDSKWLYLLLASPAIVGVLKGLWDARKSQLLTEHVITQLQETVDYHTNSLLKRSYLCRDVLRQMIPIPGFSSVSQRVQLAEQQIRWDGRVTNQQRSLLFSNIERLALQGSGMSQINAMQSLAKIVHSLSIKDFRRLQQVGYSQETLVQILRIKTQALRDLRMLSDRARLLQPQEAEQNPATALQQSLISTVYATYLLWWLGTGKLKYSPLFWSFKLGKLAFEVLFLKALVESILDVINCPDKKGFRMFFGDYAIWANDLTPDCFNEFVRQFRLISKNEPFQPFLEQLSNFDLRLVDSIDLRGKALTSNETRQILAILYQRAPVIKKLSLYSNEINDTRNLSFPDSLQSLDLTINRIGDEGAQGLTLPDGLQSLDLGSNYIGDAGAQELMLPENLQTLVLGGNLIGAKGANGLMLPKNLQSLILSSNRIGDEGAQGLTLPGGLQSLYLDNNNIGAEGAQGLTLPGNLQTLVLSDNHIGDAGARGLKLPNKLQSLSLSLNNISDEGVRGLTLPDSLQFLSLGVNHISVVGAEGLKLPENLQSLDLSVNGISDAGVRRLKLPNRLQSLNLGLCQIGAQGAQGLKLPESLTSLDLTGNNIGAGARELTLPDGLQSLSLRGNNMSAAGAQGLRLPESLTSLDLYSNGIGDEGAQGLKLPENLQSLDLSNNNIGTEGARGLTLLNGLKFLYLQWNHIGDEGAQGLKLPESLQSLYLESNRISTEGARGLKLPGNLQFLDIGVNNIGDEGVQGLTLPEGLQSLILRNNNISAKGARRLKLPNRLKFLYLDSNHIGDEGARGLTLPDSLQILGLIDNSISDEGAEGLKLSPNLQSLDLRSNRIGDEGVNALLQKIPKTKVTAIVLDGNPYNFTAINIDRFLQQQTLLRNCRDKLCHAATPLWAQQDEYQTSGATRTQPALFFSWLKKPFDKFSEYTSDCVSATLDSLGDRLKKVLSQSPSYFPNIHSPVINDWQPSGSVMLNQFKHGASNHLLLLSGSQTSIQSPLRSFIVR